MAQSAREFSATVGLGAHVHVCSCLGHCGVATLHNIAEVAPHQQPAGCRSGYPYQVATSGGKGGINAAHLDPAHSGVEPSIYQLKTPLTGRVQEAHFTCQVSRFR